ncbi:hypothetical protein DNTS_022726 [Danionella cerebrum]|uniref:Suppressor of cytokine signaling 5 n=1 Tax=Danionella cerebrum TaxID=2873325 RepID=A0A553MY72_9TELE|nr:hypothetical protein DNTS_022726 [Danionella translucida]
MSMSEGAGDIGKDKGAGGARPKVRQSRSEERRREDEEDDDEDEEDDAGGRKRMKQKKKKKKKGRVSQELRPRSDGFQYGAEMRRRMNQGEEEEREEEESCFSVEQREAVASGSSLNNAKIQDAVGQCFPLRTTNSQSLSLRTTNSQSLVSTTPSSLSRRKIHLSELMLDSCPFPTGSELAHKWHLIKQHTAPISQPPVLETVTLATTLEDEEDRLRERRRISIEQGVEPPPNAQIHTFEVTAQINPLYKLGPKLAHGMNELAADERATLHQLLLQSCLDTLDEVAASASTSDFDPSDSSQNCVMEIPAESPTSNHRVHTQIDYIHCLVPDLLAITNLTCYWGIMDRYEAETLLEGKPEGTFLLRDSAQEDYLFSVSFRRYGRSLHARIEQWNHNFSFDVHDPSVFHAATVTGLLQHYKDPNACMFFEPLLSNPLHRTQVFSLQRICRAVISSCTTYDGISVLPLPSALKEHLKEYHYKQRVRIRRLDGWWE